MRARGPWKTGPPPPLCRHHLAASPAAAGLEGRGGSGIWVSVAWGLAVWGVCAVSVDASASVQGLQTVAGAVCWRLLGLALSFCPDMCVCVCVICTIYEVDPYAAMRWQVYSAQSAVASLRL